MKKDLSKMNRIDLEIIAHDNHCFAGSLEIDMECKYGPPNECPMNPSLDIKISGLSELEKAVLLDLTEIGYDWFQGYSAIDFRGHGKKQIKKVIDKLKRMHLIEYANGLMMEDENQVAGSGWRVIKKSEVKDYFMEHETFEAVLDDVSILYGITPDVKERLYEAHRREMER